MKHPSIFLILLLIGCQKTPVTDWVNPTGIYVLDRQSLPVAKKDMTAKLIIHPGGKYEFTMKNKNVLLRKDTGPWGMNNNNLVFADKSGHHHPPAVYDSGTITFNFNNSQIHLHRIYAGG